MRKVLTICYIFLTVQFYGFSQQMTEILGRPADNSVTINVLFNSQVDLYFEYGVNKGIYSTSTAIIHSQPGQPVETIFSGLLPGTRYYYRTRFKNEAASGFLASDEHSFITQRKKGSAFRFTVEADPHPYDKKGCWPLWNIALANQLADTADFMIDMGDTFGDDHNPYTITSNEVNQLQLNCRDFFGSVCHSLPLYFCIGNHEGESGYYLLQTPPENLAMYETTWRKLYYPNPYPDRFYSGNSTDDGNGTGPAENYFAWEWGDALFVVMDLYRYADKSEKPQKWDFTIGKSQYDWLRQTLENSTARFKFVFAHHILGQGRGGIELAKSFEWGGYDGGNYKFDIQRPGWGLPIHQLMQKNKVDIFFQGHDHIYVKQELDSIVYQAVPMPSDSTYKIGVTDNGDAYLSGKQLGGSGHLRVTVTYDSVLVEFVNAMLPHDETTTLKNRDIIDSYTIVKKSGNTAIRNTLASEFQVYPNPSADEINIRFNEPPDKNQIIQILDLRGAVIKQFENHGSEIIHNIELSENGKRFPPGMYILSICSEPGRSSFSKIVVR